MKVLFEGHLGKKTKGRKSMATTTGKVIHFPVAPLVKSIRRSLEISKIKIWINRSETIDV